MYDVHGEICFSYEKKMEIFTNGLNIVLSQWGQIKKIIYVVETHWLSSKEKVPGAVVRKEDHTDSFVEHEKTHQIDSIRKKCNHKQCFPLPVV